MRSEWFERASCRGAGTDIFHPDIDKGEIGDAPWRKARSFCKDCDVKLQCLDFCLVYEEQTGRRNGMYGGMTPKERDQFVKVNRRK